MKRLLIAAGLAVMLAAVAVQITITTHNTWSGYWSFSVVNASNYWIGYNPAINGTFHPLIMPNIEYISLDSLTGNVILYINVSKCYSQNDIVQMLVGWKTLNFTASSPLNYTINYADPYFSMTIKPITSSYYYIELQSSGYQAINAPSGFWIQCVEPSNIYVSVPAVTVIIK